MKRGKKKTWKKFDIFTGEKKEKEVLHINFKSVLSPVNICIMSQCCVLVSHDDPVSEVPTERARD